jgi:prepilin-type N-terminal cleavage/methylation domain-containing protein
MHEPSSRTALAAFTLLELLVAIAIFAVVASLAATLMATVSKAWQRGNALTQDLHSGDYVVEQLVNGLSQSRWRDRNDGFLLKDNGSGAEASDSICWVKEGPDLVGEDTSLSKTFHRIKFFVGRDANGKNGALYSAWGDEYLQPDDFDSDQVEPELLSDRVVGFDCRVATNDFDSDQLHWLETWEDTLPGGDNLTNHIPRFVEVTLYLKPLEEGEPPIVMKRWVDIPVARQGMK